MSMPPRLTDDLVPPQLNRPAPSTREITKIAPKINDPGVLETVGSTAVNRLISLSRNRIKIGPDEDFPMYRQRDTVHRWFISNLLNNTTEAGWNNMVVNESWGAREDLIRVQPNGDWQPVAFRFTRAMQESVETDRNGRPIKSPEPVIYLVIRWTDLKNEEDIVYQGGAPVIQNKTVVNNPGMDGIKELLEVMQANTQNSTDTSELVAKLAKMVLDQQNGPRYTGPEKTDADEVEVAAPVVPAKKAAVRSKAGRKPRRPKSA